MPNRIQTVIGMILVLAGVAFFLDAADVISVGEIISDWWPLAIVLIGLFAMLGRTRSRTGGGLLVLIGAVLLLATTGVIDIPIWQLLIALLLIAGGVNLVLRGLRGDREVVADNETTISAILSEQRIVSEATEFRNGNITTMLGETKLDLRKARLASDGATLEVFCLLAEVTIIVPREWRVTVDGMPILADFSDGTDHQFEREPDASLLAISGVSILGEVEIRHDG